MSALFAAFMQHFLWALLVWVIVFIVFTSVFARGRLAAFARGLARLVLSIAVSPFVWLQKAAAGVLESTSEQEEAHRAGDQYLLNKAMLVLQAATIVIAIGALAAIVIVGWTTLVPPREVRDAAKEQAAEVETQRATAQQAADEVSKLEADWANQRPGVLARYRHEWQNHINQAAADQRAAQTAIQTYGSDPVKAVFKQITDAAAANVPGSRDDVGRRKQRLDEIMWGNWSVLSGWPRMEADKWIEAWAKRQRAMIRQRDVPIDELRAEAQPAFARAQSDKESQDRILASMEEELVARREAASLKWKRAFLAALRSFVSFALFVWFAGLLVESLWLVIRIAGDVRRIRETAEPRPAESAPPPAPA